MGQVTFMKCSTRHAMHGIRVSFLSHDILGIDEELVIMPTHLMNTPNAIALLHRCITCPPFLPHGLSECIHRLLAGEEGSSRNAGTQGNWHSPGQGYCCSLPLRVQLCQCKHTVPTHDTWNSLCHACHKAHLSCVTVSQLGWAKGV